MYVNIYFVAYYMYVNIYFVAYCVYVDIYFVAYCVYVDIYFVAYCVYTGACRTGVNLRLCDWLYTLSLLIILSVWIVILMNIHYDD